MRILSSLLFAAMLGTIAAQPANADDPKQPAPFAIEISAQQNTHVGAPLQLHVEITNTSKKSIVVSQDMTKKAEFFNTINVRHASGGDVAKTGGYRPGTYTFNDQAVQLQSGEAIQDETDVRTLYEIDQPGKYTIQVERFDDDSKILVKSNTITVTIVSQPSPSDTAK